MIELVVRARNAPVDADRFLAAIGAGEGVEYLADILRHSLFVSQGHRDDVVLSLILEKSADFSRLLRIEGAQLGSLADLHEAAILALLAEALRYGQGLDKNTTTTAPSGIEVSAVSFEQYVKGLALLPQPVYALDPDGADIRELPALEDVVFVMTDHTPMPKNTHKSMARQGVSKVSLGPRMLHTAQCVSILLNERDRRSPI